MLNQSHTHYLLGPCQPDSPAHPIGRERHGALDNSKFLGRNPVTKDHIRTLKEKTKIKLSFLNPYQNFIHSLILVGSTAYNVQTVNSDIDIVVVTTQEGHEQVCNFLFEKELDESLNGGSSSNIEYTVLASEHVEKLFQMSSPFAYSIRHGVVIRDDGFLLQLANTRYPVLPKQEYYTSCLYENIATPYFGLLKDIQKQVKEKRCSCSCGRKNKGCRGLLSAQLFAKLVLQMLYVTLPSRGMIPLTKGDVIAFARIAYGSSGENVAKHTVMLMQEKRSTFCFDEFADLKKFAVQLFKEILNLAGLSSKVRNILVDAARIAKKDFQSINDPSMKNCVM